MLPEELIKFNHYRDYDNIWQCIEDAGSQIKEYGGKHPTKIVAATKCEIIKDGISYFGYAFCGEHDQFSRKIGRLNSLERARKEMNEKGL